MVAMMGGAARTQSSGLPPTPGQVPSASQSPSPLHRGDTPDEGVPKDIAERQQHAREDERQKRLVADTDKLLALATSLHDDVAKTNKNVLSLDVVRRAEEIEKLARSVKERMKG